MSRYESFYKSAIIEQNASQGVSETVEQSPLSVPQLTQQHQLMTQQSSTNEPNDLKLLVYLISDIRKLCDRLQNFFDGNVAPLMRASGVKEIGFVKGIF